MLFPSFDAIFFVCVSFSVFLFCVGLVRFVVFSVFLFLYVVYALCCLLCLCFVCAHTRIVNVGSTEIFPT